MTGEQEPRATYYRQMAGKLRELAGAVQMPEVRSELLEFAERFERMAAWVARRGANEHRTPPTRDERNDG